ncbi:isochorismatase family protein [Kitasatospora sp. NPDC059811]|uniref:isochorismatase family protein n=1 Tax=Kitasatospora sp. NPDC059811 TaxID=3346957 RepID=UPI00364D3E20
MPRAVLLVVVTTYFGGGGGGGGGGAPARARAIAELVQGPEREGWARVVATRDHHIDPGPHFSAQPDFRESFPVHCVVGSEGGEFHPSFAPAVDAGAVDEVFFKGAHSASKSGFEGFAADGTRLADWLRGQGVDAVDVVGIATDHCVKATALDAVKAGFATRVLLDYTAGVATETTVTALGELRQAGVDLTGTPVVLAG